MFWSATSSESDLCNYCKTCMLLYLVYWNLSNLQYLLMDLFWTKNKHISLWPRCHLAFTAATLHNISIDGVGSVWCWLVNHPLIIVSDLSASCCFYFLTVFPLSAALFVLFIRYCSVALWKSAGRPASRHFILCVTVGQCQDSFWKKCECLLFICECVSG